VLLVAVGLVHKQLPLMYFLVIWVTGMSILRARASTDRRCGVRYRGWMAMYARNMEIIQGSAVDSTILRTISVAAYLLGGISDSMLHIYHIFALSWVVFVLSCVVGVHSKDTNAYAFL